MKRFLKHFFYGIFYLAILGGVGYLFYLGTLKPAPSCFDGIKNQNEEGIDCGGVCPNICTPGFRPITLSGPAKIFPLPDRRVSALFLMQNPNPDYAAKSMTYEFTIRDASGAAVKTVSGESFIYAGEQKYIIAPTIDIDIGSIGQFQANFSATSTVWVRAGEFEAAKLQIQSPSITESSSTITITGRLVNQDTITFPSVLLVAVFGNDIGEQAGVAQTTLENLLPGETRNFTIIHPPIPDINLPSTQIFPYALRP